PAKIFLDEGVVAVAAIDAFGSFQIVRALKLNAGDVFDQVHQTINGDQLAAAKIDRFENVAVKTCLGAFEAIIDIHEAASLMAIAPDFDFMFTGQFGLNDFTADGGGGLLA